jgi:hypothetical protein
MLAALAAAECGGANCNTITGLKCNNPPLVYSGPGGFTGKMFT